jgi:hypothetical protein
VHELPIALDQFSDNQSCSFSQGVESGPLDVTTQISAFAKLKLMICVHHRPGDRAGLFVARA